MSNFLAGLNPEQVAVVTHAGGPLLVVAGAGTGKTTTITKRIAHLVVDQQLPVDSILALTFTDKAAGELEDRVTELLPIGVYDYWISTFHGFCERLLREFGTEIGLSKQFRLLNEGDAWVLLYQNLERLQLKHYRPKSQPDDLLSDLLSHFSLCKDELISPADYLTKISQLSLEEDELARATELANAYAVYEQLCTEASALDFGGVIFMTVELLRQRPQVRQQLQRRFSHMLVDEFQDTNLAQYELMQLLTKDASGQVAGPELVVVGDDDQGIYSFRGATIANILRFTDDYPSAKSLSLIKNYRSAQQILDLAHSFIQGNNPDRLEIKLQLSKRLQSQTDTQGVVALEWQPSNFDEYAKVAELIAAQKQAEPDLLWSDFAVLSRSKQGLVDIAPYLRKLGIPVQIAASDSLFSEVLVQNLLSYARLLQNSHRNEDLYRVWQWPIFNIDVADIAVLADQARKHGWSLMQSVRSDILSELSESGRSRIQSLVRAIERDHQVARETSAAECFVRLIDSLDLRASLMADGLVAERERDRIAQLYQLAVDFTTRSNGGNLFDFVAYIDLLARSGNDIEVMAPATDLDSVSLLTIHKSKGLEFRRVFLIQMVDQRFPTRRQGPGIAAPAGLLTVTESTAASHLQEERRLCYVAITRAKEHCYFTGASDYGGARAKAPSKFLSELGLGLDLVPQAKAKLEQVLYSDALDNPVASSTFRPVTLPTNFSYTQLKTFQRCPAEYHLKHVLRLPLPGGAALSFGSSIHRALELFCGQPDFTDSGLPYLRQLLDQSWIDEWYDNPAQKRDYRDKAELCLQHFFQSEQVLFESGTRQILELEKEFILRIGQEGFELRGKIDRIDSRDGGWWIIDYKTGKPQDKTSQQDLNQLRIYQLAAQRGLGQSVTGLEYWYLETNTRVSVPLATEAELDELVQNDLLNVMHELRSAVEQGNFIERERLAQPHSGRDRCQYAAMIGA